MKLLSEAFDTVKRVYAYEKSVKADTATLQKIMAVFAIVMILIDVENIRLGKYIIGAATFFVAAVSLVAVWALDYFKNVYRVCRIAAVILLVLAVPIIFMGANDGFSLFSVFIMVSFASCYYTYFTGNEVWCSCVCYIWTIYYNFVLDAAWQYI